MILKILSTGMFQSNCYIVGDQGECMVIDAGVDAGEIIQAAAEAGLKIKYIVLTHGHVDHICAAGKLKEKTGAQLLIHEGDEDYLKNKLKNVSAFAGINLQECSADQLLQDGDVLEVGGMTAEIIHTPGHTPGGICIKVGNALFTGDTLFKTSIGRTDLPGGNQEELLYSISSKLLNMDEATVVYSGHGPATTIGHEKKYNPYI